MLLIRPAGILLQGASGALQAFPSRWQRVPCRIAMEIDIRKDGWIRRGTHHVWVDDYHAGNGIAKRVGAEIASAHRFAGDQPRKCDAVALIFLFAIEEEEGFIFANRSAERTSELVQVELFGRGRKKALGIQCSIAQKLEQRSVKGVGA